MNKRTIYRLLAVLLLAAMLVSLVTLVLAVDTPEDTSALGAADEVETPTVEVEEPTPDKVGQPADVDTSSYGQQDADGSLSDDGQELTRKQSAALRLAAANAVLTSASASAAITKSTCVNFTAYTSPYWYCNRYYTDGTHAYGHYFYASTIAYHTIDGEYAYCLEPNTSSISGATYTSYSANSASSTSYWMYELDATQRSHIQKILAFGYPSCDYGYGTQAQYAATQVLIWEVIMRQRYSDINESSDYGLYYAVKDTLGDNLYYPYMAILNAIANNISNGKAPSFASTSSSSPATITLSLNSSTNCYEATVTDSNAVLSYFTFSYSGVTFTKSGNSMKISVPASSISSVTGKTITGTSAQMNMDTSNPTIWENSTYQTVLSSGGAEYMKVYIKLDWTETTTTTPTPTPTPTPALDLGELKIIKKCTDSSVSLSGWKFSIYLSGIGTITRTTGSDGTITVTEIPDGTVCTVTETNVSGYKVLSSQSVTVYDGQTKTLTFTNQPLKGNLTVTKSVNYGTLSGFTFRLYGTSTIGKSVDVTATTDSSGKATFNNIYIGTYTLEEVDPGSAYIKPSAKTVTISANSTTSVAATATASMSNTWKYWYAAVTKVDEATGKTSAAMAGAEYTLYESGTKVATYTIGSNGSFTTDAYPCTSSNSVYTLKETKAPTGYQLDDSVYKLTTSYKDYSSASNKITLTVSDEVIKGKIQIQKYAVNTVSGDKEPEKGATFEVYLKSAGSYAKAAEDQRDIITIGSNGKGTTKDLPYGVYCIKQATGWEGYDLDETVYEASITTNGETVTTSTSKKDLTIENDIWLGTLTILKVDGDSKEPLAGAEFTLTGTDKSEQTAVTDSDGKVVFENLVYGVEYTWTETKSPKGYLLDEENTGTWNVTKHDDSIEITAEDFRRPGSISVTKQNTDGDALSGCTFLLEYLDGDTWKSVSSRDTDSAVSFGGCTSEGLSEGCLTTDESGVVTFSGLWADDELQYRLTEVAAPEGYELLSEPVYEGVLPLAYDENETSLEPDEIIDGTAYFYDLPITVKDGHIYTLPQTGGGGSPFVFLGIALLIVGGIGIVYLKNPYFFTHLKHNIRRKFS